MQFSRMTANDAEISSRNSSAPDDSSFSFSRLGRAFGLLTKSEYRVTIFVWSVTTAYLLATNLKPSFPVLAEVIVSSYFLSLGVYVFNALMDAQEDQINHPKRPIASGRVLSREGWLVFSISISIAFAVGTLVGFLTLTLLLSSFLLGIAYSHPSIRAKRRFPFKLLVSVLGAVCCSLAGGIVAGNLDGAVIFSALFFGLFAMVTLLLGDMSDIRGDLDSGTRSLPIVVGPRNAIVFIACVPLVIAFLGVAFFRMLNFNPLFPVLVLGITTFSSANIIALLGKYDDYARLGRVKSRMRLVHFALQLSLILGLIAL